jgi:LemA protein
MIPSVILLAGVTALPIIYLVVIISSVILLAGVMAMPYLVVTFNRLVNLNNLIQNAWHNVETELKRRYDLIPNLVSTVKGYAKHEKEVLERVIAARTGAVQSTGSPRNQARDENELVRALRELFVVVERYPQLKARESFLTLQEELIDTENRIQAARRFYNGNVKDLNNLVAQFPSNLIARGFGFRPAEFFEIDNAVEWYPAAVKFSG